MHPSLILALVIVLQIATRSLHAEGADAVSTGPSSFEVRELATAAEPHQAFPREDRQETTRRSTRLSTRVLLDVAALESGRVVPWRSETSGYFDIEVSFTREGSAAYDTVGEYCAGRAHWAYLCGSVVLIAETAEVRRTEAYSPLHWTRRRAF